MEAVSTILKVAQQIAHAAETARRNRARCRDLADRARTVGDILRDSSSSTPSGGGGDTASRRSALGRLKAALDDALRLIKSCRRQSGWLSWLTSGRTAARFQDVETRIDSCVGDLGIANDARLLKLLNDLAGARHRPGANTRAGSKKGTDRSNAKKKDGAKNGGNKSNTNDMSRDNAKKRDAVAKKGNRRGGTGGTEAAVGNARKKGGGQQQGGKGSRQMRGKALAAAPPPRYVVHSMEEDPAACSVM